LPQLEKKLKIGIGTDAFPPTTDGISNVAQNYANEINKNFGKAVVITPKNPNQLDYKYDYEIFRYKSWWVPSKEGYSVGWPFKDELHRAIIDKNFDLLHSHAPLATSYYFRRVAQKKPLPVVLTYHTKYEYDVDRRVPTKPVKDFAYKFLLNNINAADEVWVTSRGTADSLRKIGYTGDYIVMPNGCDLPITNVSDNDIAMIKRKHNVPEDIPIFLYSGRMIWYKNIQMILDACTKLKNEEKKFKLIMLGFGADENAIKRYIKKVGIKDDVIWTGKILDRREIQGYYGIADILLFPSVFDTNGLVVREAAACATPSLLVRDSCAAEGITDGKTGFLCMESAHSIAATLNKIMNNDELLKTVGKNAQSDIYISWHDAVKDAYSRYQIVIDNFKSKQNQTVDV
ncbi:MAG: glycosyltransferase, partial [Clostridiales bacterium]|nr:glycosyltransferase [Clostridiales bacterium]